MVTRDNAIVTITGGYRNLGYRMFRRKAYSATFEPLEETAQRIEGWDGRTVIVTMGISGNGYFLKDIVNYLKINGASPENLRRGKRCNIVDLFKIRRSLKKELEKSIV